MGSFNQVATDRRRLLIASGDLAPLAVTVYIMDQPQGIRDPPIRRVNRREYFPLIYIKPDRGVMVIRLPLVDGTLRNRETAGRLALHPGRRLGSTYRTRWRAVSSTVCPKSRAVSRRRHRVYLSARID